MSVIEGIILGVIQGLTEFLPISSSGHLILAREFLGKTSELDLAFDALLHVATILAVGLYFYKDLSGLGLAGLKYISGKLIATHEKNMLGAIIFGTVPAIIGGLLLEEYMESLFRSVELVALMLVLGSVLFIFAERHAKQNSHMTVRKGIMIGLFQCLAFIPGMSRSGSTISGGLFLGIKRDEAARFSFLLGFPILLGAGAKKMFELSQISLATEMYAVMAAGFLSAFLVGICAIHFLMKFLKNHTLSLFIIYRIILAFIVLGVSKNLVL